MTSPDASSATNVNFSLNENEALVADNPVPRQRRGSPLVVVAVRSQEAANRYSGRLVHYFRQLCCRSSSHVNGKSPTGDAENPPAAVKPCSRKYRIKSAWRKTSPTNCFQCLCFCGAKALSKFTGMAAGISYNRSLVTFLHWLFRINFSFLFLLSCFVFFGLVVIFTGFIILAANFDATCVQVGGVPLRYQGGNSFTDAFSLSWTTFSGVGYGSSSPAISSATSNQNDCTFITLLCSFESFIGVLYSGFCGAILFGKVLRILSNAQVMFSDPLVVRFGAEEIGKPNQTTTNNESMPKRISCPVLEFRVVNLLSDQSGGEILDATLNVVANVDATSDSGYGSLSRGLPPSFNDTPMNSRISANSRSGVRQSTNQHLNQPNSMDKRNNETIFSNRIFSKMRIEAPTHPFYKRIWVVQHILNESSPIVTPRTRKAIRNNGGYWPEHLNNHLGVRQSLNFNQILVSLHGISKVSASDVYAQHTYDFVDLNIGYQFVNLLFRDKDGLKVDTALMNDVVEQSGEKGEPLIDQDSLLGKNRRFLYER